MIIGGKDFNFEDNFYVMGILNVTPDSFSDGGQYNDVDKALFRVEEMISEGASIIDVGGESTRPGYHMISDDFEIYRIVPVIEAIKGRFDIPISLDTYKAHVAKAGIAAGVDMINDIWGLKWDSINNSNEEMNDKINYAMANLIAKAGVPCCIMHNRRMVSSYEKDNSQHVVQDIEEYFASHNAIHEKESYVNQTNDINQANQANDINQTNDINQANDINNIDNINNMNSGVNYSSGNDYGYDNFMEDVMLDIKDSLDIAYNMGISKDKIIIDPGIGFAKDLSQNLKVMNHLSDLCKLCFPVLLGTSRKSMIGLTLDLPTDERLEGTIATSVIGYQAGCRIFRVHDVKENYRALKIAEAIMKAG